MRLRASRSTTRRTRRRARGAPSDGVEERSGSRRWRTRGPELQGWFVDIASIHRDLIRGDGRRAWELSLPKARRFQERVFGTLMHRLEAQVFLVRAGISLARTHPNEVRAELSRCHEVVAEIAEVPSAWTRAHALCLRAGLESVEGHRDASVRTLRAALLALEDAEMPLLRALVEDALGRVLSGDEGAALVARTAQQLRRWRIDRDIAMACTLPGAW